MTSVGTTGGVVLFLAFQFPYCFAFFLGLACLVYWEGIAVYVVAWLLDKGVEGAELAGYVFWESGSDSDEGEHYSREFTAWAVVLSEGFERVSFCECYFAVVPC